jgi:DNA-directed RNA polymerase specialized sigma24 family protein
VRIPAGFDVAAFTRDLFYVLGGRFGGRPLDQRRFEFTGTRPTALAAAERDGYELGERRHPLERLAYTYPFLDPIHPAVRRVFVGKERLFGKWSPLPLTAGENELRASLEWADRAMDAALPHRRAAEDYARAVGLLEAISTVEIDAPLGDVLHELRRQLRVWYADALYPDFRELLNRHLRRRRDAKRGIDSSTAVFSDMVAIAEQARRQGSDDDVEPLSPDELIEAPFPPYTELAGHCDSVTEMVAVGRLMRACCYGRLTPRDARMMRLASWGYRHHEIAEQLDVSESTVSTAISRGRHRLNRLLRVPLPAARREPGSRATSVRGREGSGNHADLFSPVYGQTRAFVLVGSAWKLIHRDYVTKYLQMRCEELGKNASYLLKGANACAKCGSGDLVAARFRHGCWRRLCFDCANPVEFALPVFCLPSSSKESDSEGERRHAAA